MVSNPCAGMAPSDLFELVPLGVDWITKANRAVNISVYGPCGKDMGYFDHTGHPNLKEHTCSKQTNDADSYYALAFPVWLVFNSESTGYGPVFGLVAVFKFRR